MEIAEKLNAHEERAIPIQKISSKAVSLEEIFVYSQEGIFTLIKIESINLFKLLFPIFCKCFF